MEQAVQPARADESSEANEARWVEFACRGDSQAFGRLVLLHQDRIFRLAARMVGDNEAEDVAQEAFVKAWLALDSFQGGAAFGTWLYRIAVNVCLDYLRRGGRYRPMPLDVASTLVAGEDDVAEEALGRLEESEQRAALSQALGRLPSEERLLLNLRVGEGLSYERIAEVLGLHPTTVGTRLYRARLRLHRLVLQYRNPGGVSDAV